MGYDPERLRAEGWERQSVASEPRLSEIVELHRELGNEVLLVPVLEVCAGEEGSAGCSQCFSGDSDPGRFKVVFVRVARAGLAGEVP